MDETSTTERQCTACGGGFLVPEAEFRFRQERGLDVPVLCPECRSQLRAARNAELTSVDRRGEGFAGREVAAPARPARTGSRRGHHRSQVPAQRYNTVCANCGAETQVPFIPRGDRPVYCRDCFNARQGR